MSYSQASMIVDVRHFLDDNPWETTSTTTGTGATVAVPDGTKWATGDVGEWSYSGTVGGEQFLVQSISSNDLTVVRGYNGTTAEAHSSGDRVAKSPRYSRIQITDAVERVIAAAYPTIWTSVTTTVTPNTTSVWWDSTLSGTNLTGVIDLIHGTQVYGASSERIGLFGPVNPYVNRKPILFQRNLPTAFMASTIGIGFPDGFFHASNTVTLYWRVQITSTVTASAYVDLSEGLLSEAIVAGVVARLLSEKEVPNISEDSRIGQTSVGSFVNVAAVFEDKHRRLLRQYRDDLMSRIPPMPDQNYAPSWW